MLTITIPESEDFNSETNEFIFHKSQTLTLEHSLVSVSKWESKWHKPFLSKEKHSVEEMDDYIRCMTLTQNVDPSVYLRLSNDNRAAVNNYINDPMTATTITRHDNKPPSREINTSEVLYSKMVALQIPFECQKWHLNRLIMLIQVCAINNQQPKKMPKKAAAAQTRSLNAARRAALNSNG